LEIPVSADEFAKCETMFQTMRENLQKEQTEKQTLLIEKKRQHKESHKRSRGKNDIPKFSEASLVVALSKRRVEPVKEVQKQDGIRDSLRYVLIQSVPYRVWGLVRSDSRFERVLMNQAGKTINRGPSCEQGVKRLTKKLWELKMQREDARLLGERVSFATFRARFPNSAFPMEWQDQDSFIFFEQQFTHQEKQWAERFVFCRQ
jgi:hypothetical protein